MAEPAAKRARGAASEASIAQLAAQPKEPPVHVLESPADTLADALGAALTHAATGGASTPAATGGASTPDPEHAEPMETAVPTETAEPARAPTKPHVPTEECYDTDTFATMRGIIRYVQHHLPMLARGWRATRSS